MHPGQIVAERFELLALAGAGGMGEVFRARDASTGELCALKVLHGRFADQERFAREARLLSELHHPGIVRYVASGAAGGSRFLAMEWLEGEDLEALLGRRRLSTAESLELVRRAAEALGAAHARGVVHRDVKPSNLFLQDGNVTGVKLLDFGIAHARGALATRAVTHTGVALGTPGYVAPEQARGERDLDGRADVFSLGCVLFECLTGMAAFAGEHVMAILAKILLEDPPRLDEILPDAPDPLVEIVGRMLAKDRGERPRDGNDVARVLGALSLIPSLRPAAPSIRRPALTTGELRVVSVVLATREEVSPIGETLSDTPSGDTLAHDASDALLAHALAQGAPAQLLAGGSVVCVFEGMDAAPRAARLALSFAAHGALRVALATGRAVIEGRLAVGEAIDRAARLVGADALPVAIDDASAAMLAGAFEIADGALIRERVVEGSARTLMGKPTTCVGRDAELRVLMTYWDACVEEQRGQPVVVTAPAGVGKSRVAAELVRRVRASHPTAEIWTGRGDVMAAGSPLGMIKQAIMFTAGMSHGEPRGRLQAKLAARVARHVPEAERERVTLFLGEIVGASFPDEGSVPLRAARSEAILMADNTRRAWEDFVRAECAAHPVLLVLEDLHWGDGATVSYTDSALRNLGEHPWMVLALARPEVHESFPRLWADREAQEVKLAPLSRKASEKLAREVLGDRADAGGIAKLVDRAAGNAFFLEELIRAVADGNADAVPESVLAMIEQRLMGLDIEARRALRAASVMGGTFWDGAVQALFGKSDVRAWLDVLVQAELVQTRAESRFQGQREYTFRHDLVRAAVYGMLLPVDRALGHKLAAEWLERVGERDALIVAEHWEKAGDPDRAVPWFVRAVELALERNEWTAAVERADRGVACGATGEALGELRRMQSHAHFWSGQNEALARRSREAMDAFTEGVGGWFDAARCAVFGNQRLGRRDEVVRLANLLQATPAAEGAAVERTRVLWSVSQPLRFMGERELASRLEAGTEEVDDARAAAARAACRGATAMHAGDASVGMHEYEAAHQLAERAGDRRRACLSLGNLGYAQVLLGDERAEATLRRVVAESGAMGLPNVRAVGLQNLGAVLARSGRATEGEAVQREAVRAFRAHGDKRLEGASHAYLSEALWAAGDVEAAREEATRAVELLTAAPPLRPHALAVLARIERERGDLGAARTAIEEAMRGIDGVEEGEGKVRLERAEILRAVGEREAARAAIAEARARLLERAAQISDSALRESFLTRLPEHARTLALAEEWARSA
jgi:tetratricopeptide (TPR) repeat protein